MDPETEKILERIENVEADRDDALEEVERLKTKIEELESALEELGSLHRKMEDFLP